MQRKTSQNRKLKMCSIVLDLRITNFHYFFTHSKGHLQWQIQWNYILDYSFSCEETACIWVMLHGLILWKLTFGHDGVCVCVYIWMEEEKRIERSTYNSKWPEVIAIIIIGIYNDTYLKSWLYTCHLLASFLLSMYIMSLAIGPIGFHLLWLVYIYCWQYILDAGSKHVDVWWGHELKPEHSVRMGICTAVVCSWVPSKFYMVCW